MFVHKKRLAVILSAVMCFSNSVSVLAEDISEEITDKEYAVYEVMETAAPEEQSEEIISEGETEGTPVPEAQETPQAEEIVPEETADAAEETKTETAEEEITEEIPAEETAVPSEESSENTEEKTEEEPRVSGEEEAGVYDTEGDYTYTVQNETAQITAYNGTDTDVVIPDMLGGYPVTIIGNNVFKGKTITSVSIPDSVTKLYTYVFQNCKSLTSVHLPDGLNSIGQFAFSGCSALKEINVPSSLTQIGKSAFSGCTQLEAFTLPHGIDYIGSNAFYNCSKMTYFFIPKTLRTAESGAFHPAVTIEFEEGTAKIADGACFNAGKLTSVIIPETVTVIGNNAFSDCKSLTGINLPEGLTAIGYSAFENCQKLTSVTIPEGVTGLPNDVFKYCYALKEIAVPEGVTSIGNNAFLLCKALSKVQLPSTLESIGSFAFGTCDNLRTLTIPANVATIGGNAFNTCEELIFEDGMRRIPDSACYRANKLVRAVIPESVTEIGSSAFAECPLLKELILPDNVVSYGTGAFYKCAVPEEINVPADSVIGNTAFQYCTGLKKITLGDRVTVNGGAFAFCSNVSEVSLGSDLILNEYSFADFVMKGALDNGISYELDANSRVLTVSGEGIIPDFSDESEAPWIGLYDLIEGVEINEGITAVGNNAFHDAHLLSYVLLPDTLTEIGEAAFIACDNLSSLEIPENVNIIDSYAFADCSSLSRIVFCGDAPDIMKDGFRISPEVFREIFAPSTSAGWSHSFVTRNGIPLPIYYDDTMDEISIMLLLDISDSMEGKMDTMKDAVNRFIEGIGGRINKANIAVMAYDNNTKLVSQYTTDIAKLKYTVNRIQMGAGTQYATALRNASNVIHSTSKAGSNYIVMFSDGEPKDNVNTIYSVADSLRTDITMFTVLVNDSVLKGDVLKYIAGDENRFYWVERIENLINAFSLLKDDLRRSEQTTYTISRQNVSYDLLSDEFNFQLNSMELVSVTINPAIGYGDYGKVVLEQYSRDVLTSEKGRFALFSPGREFVTGFPIYAVIYDKENNELERKELPIYIRDEFQVRYMMNDGTGKEYTTQTVRYESEISPPEDPKRSGYKFRGWYASKNCEGQSFFSAQNSLNKSIISNHLTLYAKWSKFATGTDTFSFLNTIDFFGDSAGKNIRYEIKRGDLDRLLSTANSEKTYIKNEKAKKWGGSCFGMSSAAVLAFNGDLDISVFKDPVFNAEIWKNPIDAKLVNNTKGDLDVGYVESMINFYQLRQVIGKIDRIRGIGHNSSESDSIQQVIQKMKSTDGPCVIGLFIDGKDIKGERIVGYHAVVGFDFKDLGSDTYSIRIYDCNISPYKDLEVKLKKNGSKYTANYGEWKKLYDATKFRLNYAMNANDLKQYRILTAPNTLSKTQDVSAENAEEYYLETEYSSFTITDGTHTAVIKDGELYTGDFDALNIYGLSNNIYETETYAFGLPVLETGSYQIIPEIVSDSKSTVLFYPHETEGFCTKVQAGGTGKISFSPDGSVQTEFEGSTEQRLLISSNAMHTSWSSTEITGSAGSLSASCAGNEIHIISAEDAVLNITVNSDHSSGTFENVQAFSGKTLKIIEAENDICRIIADEETIAEEAFGYTVVFDSQLGTDVPDRENVPKNSMVVRPEDPERKGYFFEGWFKDENYAEEWDFETDTIQKDTVLYAGWSLDPNYYITVTFRLPGGSEEIITVEKGYALDAKICPAGIETWYTDSSCIRAFVPGSKVKGNTVLYANGWNGTPAESIAISKESLTVKAGKTEQLSVQVLPEDAVAYLSWISSDESVVKVDHTGTVTGVSEGTAWVTVSAGFGLTAACEVTVTAGEYTEPSEYDPEPEADLYVRGIEAEYAYTGAAIKPVPAVYDSGVLLTAGKDYTVSYKNNTNAKAYEGEDRSSYTPAKGDKTPYILITGKGNYSGKTYVPFSITQADLSDSEQVYVEESITLKANNKVQRPVPVITFNGKVVSSKEYTLTYIDEEGTELDKKTGPKEAGTYTIHIEGNDKNFTGGKDITLTISETEETAKVKTVALSKAVTVKAVPEVYDGEEHESAVVESKSGYELEEDKDYTIVYTKNINAGTATVTVTGKGIYTGSVKKTFKINPLPYVGNEDQFSIDVSDAVYSKGGAIPEVTVTWNGTELIQGTDYTLKYANNKAVTTENTAKMSSVTVTFKGNFKGKSEPEIFEVNPKPLKNVYVTAKDMTYTEKAGKYKSTPVLTDSDGKKLKAGTDYEKVYAYTVNGQPVSDPVPVGTVVTVTIAAKEGENYTGETYTTYRILEAKHDISKASFKISQKEYTGQAVTLEEGDIIAKINGEDMDFGEDYVIESYTNNVNKGTAKVTFRGINSYGGTKTVSFKIGQRSIQDAWNGVRKFFTDLF